MCFPKFHDMFHDMCITGTWYRYVKSAVQGKHDVQRVAQLMCSSTTSMCSRGTGDWSNLGAVGSVNGLDSELFVMMLKTKF